MAFSMQFSFAQEKTVTGVVSDELGPIAGANIVVQGTARGAVTDFDGNYSISAKQGEVLVISYVGKKDASVTVGAANAYNVSMQEGLVLDEVVVTGIVGVKRKADAITSSYAVVKASELTQAANPNAIQSLTGKVTGLTINTTSNGVNQTTSVVLRGLRSISGNNQALIVIDNAISTASVMASLSPEIIESVNVIKGGQGAALYGDKGVNGVIVVTTKRGSKDDKVNVSINSSVTFENVAYMAQRQERYGQGWSGTHVAYENGAWGAEMDGVIRPVGQAQADGTYIMAPYSPIKDNVKDFFQQGTVYQNGVSIGGGTPETGYASVSLNNQQTEFVVENDKLSRTTLVARGGKKMGKWSIDANTQFFSQKTSTTTSDLLTELYQAATNIPIQSFRNSGNEGHWTSYYNNPYWRMDNERFERRRDYFSGSVTLGYQFNKNIAVNYIANVVSDGQSGMDHVNGYNDVLQNGGGNLSVISSFDQFNSGTRRINSDLVVNFDYDLTKDISLNAALGNNIQDVRFQYSSAGGTNLTIPGFYNMDNVEKPVANQGNTNSRSRSYSFFANVDLGYKDFLFLNGTGRVDNVSEFVGGSNGSSYFYPSAGLSFIPTKAFDGLKSNKGLNFLKLYGSFVINGNRSDLLAYEISPVMVAGSGFPFAGGTNSFGIDFSPTDNALKPEFMTTVEAGINLGFFKDRLTLDVSAYKTTTDDLITDISASRASGVSRVKTNIGQMTNKGLEIDLGFTPIVAESFNNLGLRWENKLGYTTYKAVVDKVSDDAIEVNLLGNNEVGIYAIEGEEFPSIKGTSYMRDDQGRVIIDATTGNPMRDPNLKILGKSTPDYILNYNTAFEFKGIRLSAVMDYRTGHQFWSGTKDWLAWSGHLYESGENGRTGFIFPNSSVSDGAGGYVANTNVVTGGNNYNSYLSYFQDEYSDIAENFILDATAFKVRELALSYSFSDKVLGKTGLTNLRLGVNARNPFTVLPAENRGYSDPETSFSSGNASGLSNVGQYPTTRTFAVTLNASF